MEARDELPALAPYSARWDVKRRLTRSVSHVLVTLREQLDSMRDEHVCISCVSLFIFFWVTQVW